LNLGLALVRREPPPMNAAGKKISARSPFLRKLALSAAQADGALSQQERDTVVARAREAGMADLVDRVASAVVVASLGHHVAPPWCLTVLPTGAAAHVLQPRGRCIRWIIRKINQCWMITF
jgi:hypothetical protein